MEIKKHIAEATGAFIIVFLGTGAIVLAQETALVNHLGISIAFGVAVSLAIYSVARFSGGHFNPAVTIALSAGGHFPANKIAPYIISQIAGALAASLILKIIFPANQNLGVTSPSGGVAESFFLEFLMTFILMTVILVCSQSKGFLNKIGGVLIGLTVFLEAFLGGPISGASMNPARSIGPAVIAFNFTHLWLYIAAPIAGALVAALIFKLIKQNADKQRKNMERAS